jgi:hypothetical protein
MVCDYPVATMAFYLPNDKRVTPVGKGAQIVDDLGPSVERPFMAEPV